MTALADEEDYALARTAMVDEVNIYATLAHDYVRDVRCPVLVAHRRDDKIIPFHHGEDIFALANDPRTLLVLRGTHNDAFLRDERPYIAGVQTFLTGLSMTASRVKR